MEASTPLSGHSEPVRAEWIDYNGHMNLAYYVLVFDHATDALFDRLGIGRAYRAATDQSLFAVETHTVYEREVGLGALLEVESRVIGADAKRLHLHHRMTEGGTPVASTEIMALHVDMGTRRTAAFPPDVRARLFAAAEADRGLPLPPGLGRRIAMPA